MNDCKRRKLLKLTNKVAIIFQTYWCIYLNSVCNPVIYALRSEAFREGYKQVFCAGSLLVHAL